MLLNRAVSSLLTGGRQGGLKHLRPKTCTLTSARSTLPHDSCSRSTAQLKLAKLGHGSASLGSVNSARLYSHSNNKESAPKGQDIESSSKPETASSRAKALLAKTLHEDIYTIPNLLTISRIVAAPFLGYCVLHDHHTAALSLLTYSALTDLLDGWIARAWNQKTVVGTVIDPMADKALMAILTVTLAMKGALPVWLASIILGRDVGLGLAAIYYRWISLPPPKTFMRYWDFSLPSAEVHPTTISKYNTFLQLALIGLTTAAPVISYDLSTSLTIMQYVVATTTIWSGASYVYTKDAVKILKAPQSQNKK